jgi:chemotaxis protein CheD
MPGEPRSILAPPAGTLVVDVAAYCVSDNPAATLVTYALGSCIAVTAHEPGRKVAGMIHVMLPLSKMSRDRALSNPAMFADTGIPAMFKALYERGCRKENLVVKLIGGAGIYDDGGAFAIGERNVVMARKMFWKNGILLAGEDTGGSKSRTVRLHVGTGTVVIRTPTEETVL